MNASAKKTRKPNKSDLKKMRMLARQIPRAYYGVTRSSTVSGSDLIENGVEKLENGAIVDAEKRYTRTFEVQRVVNHYNRIKKLFRNHGMSAVEEYVHKQIELAKQSGESVTLGGIQTTSYATGI